MKPVFIDRTPGLYDADEVSRDTGIACVGDGLTVQADAESADINTIVRRFGITGTFPVGLVAPSYADYEGIFDFQSAQNKIIEAREAFMRVPAAIRARFGNDPQEFLEFCVDPANLDELRRLGLAVKPAEGAPASTPAVPPGTPAAPPASGGG